MSFSSMKELIRCTVNPSFNPVITLSAGGATDCSDNRSCAPPVYTAKLLTLHEHRANNQYRTANQINPIFKG